MVTDSPTDTGGIIVFASAPVVPIPHTDHGHGVVMSPALAEQVREDFLGELARIVGAHAPVTHPFAVLFTDSRPGVSKPDTPYFWVHAGGRVDAEPKIFDVLNAAGGSEQFAHIIYHPPTQNVAAAARAGDFTVMRDMDIPLPKDERRYGN